jgi:iron complex outermembrane receptor protein
VELSRDKLAYDFYSGRISNLDIFNPVYGAPAPENLTRSNEEYGGNNIGIYLQDLVELTPQIKLLTGGVLILLTLFIEM